MPVITMYRTRFCPYCIGAERLLKKKQVVFEEISVDHDTDNYDKMVEISGRTSVPQIFINNLHVGGFDELSALDQAGELDKLLLQE